jgi:formiminotetrahydrofolate cyclodeaminase
MTENDLWVLIYSQIVAIQHHPKNAPEERMTREQCLRAADDYVRVPPERLDRGR